MIDLVESGVGQHPLGHEMFEVFIEDDARPLRIIFGFSPESEMHDGIFGDAVVLDLKQYVIGVAGARHGLGSDAEERVSEPQFHP